MDFSFSWYTIWKEWPKSKALNTCTQYKKLLVFTINSFSTLPVTGLKKLNLLFNPVHTEILPEHLFHLTWTPSNLTSFGCSWTSALQSWSLAEQVSGSRQATRKNSQKTSSVNKPKTTSSMIEKSPKRK